MIGHLGHFLLDFFDQIWTQGTLRHILGPILVIIEIVNFWRFQGRLSSFQKMGGLRKFYSETDGPHLDIQIWF